MSFKPLAYSDAKRIQKMSLNELNRWVISIYGSGHRDGEEAAFEGASVFGADELRDYLQTVPGIGPKTAERVVAAMLAYDANT